MWSENADEDTLGEFDSCGLCDRATSLLVYVRMADILAGICGECIRGMQAAYLEMMSRRIAKDTAGKASFEP
jgi:hypothetical protein